MLNKKYWTLLPIFLVIVLMLFINLPENRRPLVMLVPIVFWATYYTWVYVEKTRKSKKNN